jgi:hypothetical protein
MTIAASAAAPVSKVAAVAAVAASTQSSIPSLLERITPDAMANGVTTLIGSLIGAGVGAMGAYYFQRLILKKQDEQKAELAAHRTMFAMLQQLNTIILIQRDHVFSELKNPARFLSIPALTPFDIEKNVLDMDTLAFLIDTGKGRGVLYDFYIAQENYIEALRAWNERSLMHRNELQPRLSSLGLESGTSTTREELRAMLGIMLFDSLVNATDNCIESLKRAFRMLSESNVDVRNYIVQRFKKDDFTKFDFPETYGLVDKLSDPVKD